MNTKMHNLFIKYYVDKATGEYFPMEIKPSHINITEYDINYDRNKQVINAIINKKLKS